MTMCGSAAVVIDDSGKVTKEAISEAESCAITLFIARRTGVRKRAPHRRLPASGGPKNPLRRQVPLLLGSVSVPPCGALTSTAASPSPATNG